jgi:hypothetical protein
MDFERVYTMTDFFKGPREGIADCDAEPHLFTSQYRDLDGVSPDVFWLTPVDAETLALALEDWQIWRRWEAAYNAGLTNNETHPALDADRARHQELAALLGPRLKHGQNPRCAKAEFRTVKSAQGGGSPAVLGIEVEVRWQKIGLGS